MCTENDVMPVSPLVGVFGQRSMRIMKRTVPYRLMRLNITVGLSLVVFELLTFVCGPEKRHTGFSAG